MPDLKRIQWMSRNVVKYTKSNLEILDLGRKTKGEERMKIAILIDFLEGRGGGEKLTYFLAKKYNADIYTGYANWDKILPEFKQMHVKTFDGISRIPIIKQEQLVKRFSALDLSDYTVVICLGYYSIYASHKNKIWYSYGLSPLFYKKVDRSVKDGLFWKIGTWIWKMRIKKYDKETVSKIKKIVIISKYTKKMLDDYYDMKNSSVINPPADTKQFYNKSAKDYYLLVSRFESGKRVELAIESFKKMPDKKLYIEGSGTMETYLKQLADNAKNITFLGRVPSEELTGLYANCIALVVTSFYDGWSMPMVETLASGKPCIAVNQGAFPEIIDENSGVLVEGTPEGIMKGVKKITPKIAAKMKNDCIKRAKEFDINFFNKKWDKLIRGLK